MKTRIIFRVLAAVVLLNAAIVFAQTSREDFYNACIDKRIAECEIKASLDDTQSSHLLQLIVTNRDEAVFYKDNRDELVKQMLARNLETKTHAVDHFLIRAFFAEYPRALASAR